jgi:SAM-dependent methyltransferase
MQPISSMTPTEDVDTLRDRSFTVNGRRILSRLVNLAGLRPADAVLDLGCGSGRLAIQMTDFLSPIGSYLGLDVFLPGLQWCTNSILPSFSNFSFSAVDVHNGLYNPRGSLDASEIVLPCASESIDVAVLNSLFTHMLPADLEHYVAEIGRVLRPGGRVYSTFFALDSEAERNISLNKSTQKFDVSVRRCRVSGNRRPEAAIGYCQTFIEDVLDANNIRLLRPIYYGSWSGRKTFVEYQDVVIGLKQFREDGQSRRRIRIEALDTQMRINLLSSRLLLASGQSPDKMDFSLRSKDISK